MKTNTCDNYFFVKKTYKKTLYDLIPNLYITFDILLSNIYKINSYNDFIKWLVNNAHFNTKHKMKIFEITLQKYHDIYINNETVNLLINTYFNKTLTHDEISNFFINHYTQNKKLKEQFNLYFSQ